MISVGDTTDGNTDAEKLSHLKNKLDFKVELI